MTATHTTEELREEILAGRTSLGIEFGSTRIKACLIANVDPNNVIAVGGYAWENSFVDRLWTYSLDEVTAGLQGAYAGLVDDVVKRYGVRPDRYSAIGISGMMHGYLAFDDNDELLVPFRTWRNTNTSVAAAELSKAFGVNIPLMVMLTYAFGCALAAFAGVLAAPVVQVSPLMGQNLIIVVFAVVVVGGSRRSSRPTSSPRSVHGRQPKRCARPGSGCGLRA